jgi:hypothetical protein
MRIPLAIAGLALSLSGCVGIPGDGIVQVVGEIVPSSEDDPGCSLSLHNAAEPERVLEAKGVSGRFTVNFMVPPTRSSYLVELSCGGASKGTIVVSRPQREAADFGRVAL